MFVTFHCSGALYLLESHNECSAMDLKEELALVKKAQAGDTDAVGLLWDAITPKLYGYLRNVLREAPAAEDMLQETWLKAVSSLPSFRSRGVRFSAWLFAIARNECRQRWRTQGREVPFENIPESTHNESVHGALSEKLFLEKILHALSDDDQEILRLRYIADLTFKDIAQVLGITLVSARVRVHRALKKAGAEFSDT